MPANPRSFLVSLARRVLPKPVINLLTWQRESIALRSVPQFTADFSRLRPLRPAGVASILDAATLDAEWLDVRRKLEELRIWNAPGTTGADDLEPLYRLARHFRARSILEVGTHIGGSTVTLATAVRNSAREAGGDLGELPGRLVSVDVIDVNDRDGGPWIGAGSKAPPADCLHELGLGDIVTFHASDSVEFLGACREEFDFVFLDGDHAARTVYREIGLVARCLAPDALLTLHDYSPRAVVSTYPDGRTIPGPLLATRRVTREHPNLHVIAVSALSDSPAHVGSYVALLAAR